MSHDNLFHTVLGMLDVATQEHRSDLDLFEGCTAHPYDDLHAQSGAARLQPPTVRASVQPAIGSGA